MSKLAATSFNVLLYNKKIGDWSVLINIKLEFPMKTNDVKYKSTIYHFVQTYMSADPCYMTNDVGEYVIIPPRQIIKFELVCEMVGD